MHLAQPALGKLHNVDRQDPRVAGCHAVDQRGRAVGRTIVDEHDFQIRVVLLQDRAQCRFERSRLVAGGNDNGDSRQRRRRRGVGLRQHRHRADYPQRADQHPQPIDTTQKDVSDEDSVEYRGRSVSLSAAAYLPANELQGCLSLRESRIFRGAKGDTS